MSNEFFLSHLCVSSLMWRHASIDEVARSMMQLGLVHLELAARPLAEGHYQPGGDNSRLFNVLAEAGVSVAVLRLTGLTHDEKVKAIDEAGRRRIPTVLDRAELLAYPDLVDRTRLYANCAARGGVQFILDNHYFSSCDCAEAQVLLGDTVRHPGLGFGLAPPYALASGKDPAEEVRVLGKRLRIAHLWDVTPALEVSPIGEGFDPGPAAEQAPGSAEGRVDWRDYFAALRTIKFRGIFNLKWLGEEDWTTEQTENKILEAVQYCHATATEVGLGPQPVQSNEPEPEANEAPDSGA